MFLPLPSECSSELDNAEFSVEPLFRASYASRGLDSTNLRAKAPPRELLIPEGILAELLRSIGKGLARQGIEPWSTDYETAALPLSYRATGLRFDTTFLSSFGQLFGSLQDFTPCDSYGSPSSFRTRTSTPVPFRASANSSGFEPR